MNPGASARRAAFWALDAARGGHVKRHLDDIRASMERPAEPSRRLEPLLEHAIRTTPFYASVEQPSLEAFPVLLRSTVQQEPESLYSTSPDHAAVRVVTTSGSSGRAVTVKQDQEKRRRSIADTIYVNEMCGQRLGEPLVWMRVWWSANRKPRLVRRAQNITTFDVRGLDDERLAQIVDTLRSRRINALLAHTSALQTILGYVQERGLEGRAFGLGAIINDAEMLSRALRQDLEAAFGCPVTDRYANEENGMLAFVAPGTESFRLNQASYVFEFLDLEADRPQRAGEMARLVVTDLFNRAMPLIRYDTGDLAMAPADDGAVPTSFERLEGRRADVVRDTAGRLVSTTMLAITMERFPRLHRYQLQQLDAHAFRMCVVDAEGAYKAPDIARALYALLGEEAMVTVDNVVDIPVGTSGKFHALVPLAD